MMRLTVAISVVALLSFISASPIAGQGLFESATVDTGSASLSLSGYLKTGLFAWKDHRDEPYIQGVYSELSLKPSVKKASIGSAFADLRLKAGMDREIRTFSPDIREAWIAVTPGIVEVTVGRQIISWGRADGINPTNNITPMDQTVLSSEFDDTRIGNELVTMKTALHPLTLEAIWIPTYRPDVIPLTAVILPASITIGNSVYPGSSLKNSGYALKLDFSLPRIDAALSWFDGWETQPGFDYLPGPSGMALLPSAYRIMAPGADFATTLFGFGLRGECAAKITDGDDYPDLAHIPNPTFQHVLGIDRTMGDWLLLVQYAGYFVHAFTRQSEQVLTNPLDPNAQVRFIRERAAYEMERLNRLFTNTTDEWSHALTGTLQWTTLHETLHLECSGMYNITTRDYAVNPRASYDLADAFRVTAGGRYLNGPGGSLHDLVRNILNQGYLELQVSF